MSTYINVYKKKSKYTTLYLVICLAISLLGAIGLVLLLWLDRSLIPIFNESSYFILIFNGLISFFIVRDSVKKAKYFVAWNDDEITYLLPKTKQPETIRRAEIKSIEMNRTKILIGLEGNITKPFDLFYFFYPERQIIVDFFEKIDQKLAG